MLATRSDTDTRFERLVADHSTSVWRFAHAMLGDPHDADEVAQDTFLKVHANLETYRGEASERTWILAICRNVCIDRLRLVRRDHASLEELRDSGVDPPDPRPDPADGTAIRRALTTGAADLPDDEREAFVLVDVLGLTGTEAAAAIGVAPTTVRSRLHRAHTKLVAHLLEGDV